jgi:hypothetical protein
MTRRIVPLLLAFALALQATWYILLLVMYIRTPANVQGADFSVFYTAARIAASGQYSLLYDIPTQVKIQESIWGMPLLADEILPFNHPPLLVPVLQVICTDNYISSYLRWLALLACFVAAAGFLLDRLLKSLQWKSAERGVFADSGHVAQSFRGMPYTHSGACHTVRRGETLVEFIVP